MTLKKLLRLEQTAMYVSKAVFWAEALVEEESRRPGDYDNAMRRVGAAIGIGYSALWGLRYRRPKRVFADVYFRLKLAYEAMRELQLQALERELAEAKAAGALPHHVDEAETVVRAARISNG